MTTDFRALPSGELNLTNLSHLDGTRGDLAIRDGRIVAAVDAPPVDMAGALALPAFVDLHTHLDKGHIWPRSPNPDGTFFGALETVAADRAGRWRAEDVRARMEFALRCAWAHGTRAIRTHLDAVPPQDDISVPVFREVQADWRGRIDLQAACLVGIDLVDEGRFAHTADLMAATEGGVLGCVTWPVPDLVARLETFFRVAADRGLPADFHVDETHDPASNTLLTIAETARRVGFDAPITVGHCCALARQPDDVAARTIEAVARAGLTVVSLPLCNLYLQDRTAGRTPRWRGVTLVHELAAAGVPVAFASDNTRDPFYAYGDLDMLEVAREATRIAHLDHAARDWWDAFAAVPAQAMGIAPPSLEVGAPADLILCRARTVNELLSRPQADRIVIRAGRVIDRTLPDYAELDSLMEDRA